MPDSARGAATSDSDKGKGDAESSRFGSLIPRGATSWLGPRRKSSNHQPSASSGLVNGFQRQKGGPGDIGRVPSPPPRPENSKPELRRIHTPDGQAIDNEWLLGEHRAERAIRLIRNPDPEGGYSVLNEHAKGFVKGLGAYDIRCWSDIASPLLCRLS